RGGRAISYIIGLRNRAALGLDGQHVPLDVDDRTHIQVTWVDRNSFHNSTLTVADQTCDDHSTYATLTMNLCRQAAGTAEQCETRYIAVTPYYGS
ncbi:hypothetical protein, partial [Streptomyces sp. NPDC019890]|uniref:hypothetical protein n=1 Tax=Streptomyces sp. NPDC019890 TaxID=3365064 RepID=UPI003850877E